MASFRRSVRQGSNKGCGVQGTRSRGRVSGSGVLVRNYSSRTRGKPRVRRDSVRVDRGEISAQDEGRRVFGGRRSPGCVGDKRHSTAGMRSGALADTREIAGVDVAGSRDAECGHSPCSGVQERQVLAGEGSGFGCHYKVGGLLGPWASVRPYQGLQIGPKQEDRGRKKKS